MDLNQLLYHHQMALIAANRAHRDGRPHANFDLPRYYAKRIGEYRARRGLGVGPALMADRDGGPRADPPTSAQGDDYPVFLGDTLVAELLVNKALAMTEAERAACALGGIAERLTDLHEELWVIGHDIYQALDLDEEKLAKLAADLPPPPPPHERQAVHLRPFRPQSDEGIVHSYVDQFSVGSFRYTNIEDARAALRRQRESAANSGRQANDA